MILRALLLLLALSLAPAAVGQAVRLVGLRDAEACASRGASEDPTDVDPASCRPLTRLSRGDWSEVDSQGRIVWVRGRVVVPEGYAAAEPLGVFTGALAAREIWWNGERIGGAGRPGASREAEIPGDIDAATWIPPHLIREGGNDIAIRYSTFHLDMRIKSPVHYAFVGPVGRVDYNAIAGYGQALATTGVFVAGALFFGFTFVASRSLGSLFIALMSLFAVGQLWLEALRGFTSFVYPLQLWRLSGIGILALAFGMALTAYVAHRFAPRRWRLHAAAAAAAGLALWPILPGFDGMTLGFIFGPSVVSLAAALQGIHARRSGAIVASIALAVFATLPFIETVNFLNRTFYIAVSLLMLVLFVDQARVLRRAREAEEQARRRATMLELELLRRRIAPHFLMNTLNALADWVESDPKTGVKMIEALAEEFRLLSQISDRSLIPLGEEIALCRRHLEVMSYRVDRPFSLATRNVDETAEAPPGVLHTLIENAFTHGRFADGGEFVLTREEGDGVSRLVLITPPASEQQPHSDEARATCGEGLAYVRRRLEAAFGSGARVESGAVDRGWRTVLTIPRAGPAGGLAT